MADGTGPRVSIAVALLSLGEGWHDYHHLFPWDYAAAAPEKKIGNFGTNLFSIFRNKRSRQYSDIRSIYNFIAFNVGFQKTIGEQKKI